MATSTSSVAGSQLAPPAAVEFLDPFVVLGILPTTPMAEIKKARKRLLAANHPERHKGALYDYRRENIEVAFAAIEAQKQAQVVLPLPQGEGR